MTSTAEETLAVAEKLTPMLAELVTKVEITEITHHHRHHHIAAPT